MITYSSEKVFEVPSSRLDPDRKDARKVSSSVLSARLSEVEREKKCFIKHACTYQLYVICL